MDKARRNRRNWRSGTNSCGRSWKHICNRWFSWKRRSSRARAMSAKAAEREQIQQALQQRAKTLETGRQNVLRLLGESSALKNQLMQIGEYLSASERDTARCQRDEQTAAADLERHAVVKAELSRSMSARQMELESTADKRRRVEDELNLRKTQAAEARKTAGSIAHRCLAIEGAQGFARRDSFPSRLYCREREAFVHRHRARRGRGISRGGRAGGFRGSGAGLRKGHRRFPARRAGICGGAELERCRARAST